LTADTIKATGTNNVGFSTARPLETPIVGRRHVTDGNVQAHHRVMATNSATNHRAFYKRKGVLTRIYSPFRVLTPIAIRSIPERRLSSLNPRETIGEPGRTSAIRSIVGSSGFRLSEFTLMNPDPNPLELVTALRSADGQVRAVLEA
jgi:hypothetical protein